MKCLSSAIAIAAAIGLAAVGFVYGTYAAGGSDSSCYALMAEAFASGKLQPSSALAAEVPWPDASKTFTPGGFVPSEKNSTASAPVCAPGFSLLVAPFVAIAGPSGLFLVTPLAGAALVWLTFLAGRFFAGPLGGAMSAVLTATSPAVLYQIVQPMNDVTTAALWMGVFVALSARRFVLAGVCCGLALLVRPNLLPLAVVAGLFVLTIARPKQAVGFYLAAVPGVLVALWLNAELYGGPFRSGYGELEHLFALSAFPTNAARYVRWIVETQTPFPFLSLAAPFLVPRERRQPALLALALIGTTGFIYFAYRPFEDWSYLRFLLPAIVLMVVLASAVSVALLQRVEQRYGPSRHSGFAAEADGHIAPVIVAAITVGLALFGVRTAQDRFAFTMHALEQRYRSAGIVVRDRLPEGAVVLAVWESGSVRFHGRKEALTWEGLDPTWLDRALAWLTRHGREPYILVESWEEPAFRARFSGHSAIGNLDWPPKYEVDRVVRIYDPDDRARYVRGQRVVTEYLWPSRVK
jgi:hypothetical protein